MNIQLLKILSKRQGRDFEDIFSANVQCSSIDNYINRISFEFHNIFKKNSTTSDP